MASADAPPSVSSPLPTTSVSDVGGSAAGPSSSSSASPSAPVVRTPLKRFSHAQIAEKVRERAAVSDYFALLMSAAVKEDEHGVVFDSSSRGWKELVRRCDQADQADRERRARAKGAAQHSPDAEADSAVPPPVAVAVAVPPPVVAAAATGSGRRSSVKMPAAAMPSDAAPSSSSSSFFTKVGRIIAATSSVSAEGSGAADAGEQKKAAAARRAGAGSQAPSAAASAARSVNFQLDSEGSAAGPAFARPLSSPHAALERSAASAQQARRAARRATANPGPPSTAVAEGRSVEGDGSPPASAAPAAAVSADGSLGVDEGASGDGSGARVRRVRSVVPAVHRASVAQIRRAASKELRDSAHVQADLAFEARLRKEVDGGLSAQQISDEWRERRARELERDAERKRREEEEEQRRVQAGGRKRRKLQIPPPPVITLRSTGAVVDELDYCHTLLRELEQPDEAVDWALVRQIASIIGIPHGQRRRVWSVLLTGSSALPGQLTHTATAEKDDDGDARGQIDGSGQRPQLDEGLPAADESRVAPSSASDASLQVDVDGAEASLSSPPSPTSMASSSLPSPKLDLINQRVIRVDIERTLPHFVTMQRPDVRHDMEVLLTRSVGRSPPITTAGSAA